MSTTEYAPESGDVIWTDFEPRTGREQGGRRPALVISPRPFYDGTRFIVVCPITSRIRPFGSSVVLPAESPIKGEILVSQLRSLDALARPVRFSGVKVDGRVLADVKRKIAFLCEISPGDIAEA